MIKKKRFDGTYLKGLHHFVRIIPYFMPTRSEATIYFEQELDITECLKFLKAFNRNLDPLKPKLTFFQLFLCAGVRTVATRPMLNRFVSGKNYYQRNEIIFNFVAKRRLTDEGEEINVKIAFSPFETLHTIGEKITDEIRTATREDGTGGEDINALLMKFPRWFLTLFFKTLRFLDFHNSSPKSIMKVDPFYSTVFLTNVGSIGIDTPFHHNYEWGTCGLFVALGKVRREWRPDKDGNPQQRDLVKVTFTYDDRMADGVYVGKSINIFRSFVENPESLAGKPDISEEMLKELMLKDCPPR
ncbi:MAG: hypothetical protein HN368_13140 [Spirochaetales bacterium]|jgi:hypothetical protein|nr:hypothetical protein [Spirochaetales bacterium]